MASTLVEVERTPIRIPSGNINLQADVALPDRAAGLVIFAHGSGSSRHSSRNRHVADILNRGQIATVLADLFTMDEEAEDRRSAELRFNIGFLVRRLMGITDWVRQQDTLKTLGLGYFGASTGAAAALAAAAESPGPVRAIVSRGGRPDLTGPDLGWVRAPCLFVVGGDDLVVLDLNRAAMSDLPPETERRLEIIPGATHLFEEPGALDRVADLALDWFQRHFAARV